MFGFGSSMQIPEKWREIQSMTDLQLAEELSYEQRVVIFKHSTRCGISTAAKRRLETASTNNPEVIVFYLDLLAHRAISNAIAERYRVVHQSPQTLVLEKGKVVTHGSHDGVGL